MSTIISFNIPNHRVLRDSNNSNRFIGYSLGFREVDFSQDIIATSDCNTFIPIIGLLNHELLEFENGVRILEYNPPIITSSAVANRQYANLFGNFISGDQTQRFYFTLEGVTHHVYTHRGILYDADGIIMCLGIDTEYALSTSLTNLQTSLDNSKLVLFISELIDKPQYKNLKKKIETTYLSVVKPAGIDIITTTRLNNWMFKNNFVAPRFRTPAQMSRHLREEIPANLLIE